MDIGYVRVSTAKQDLDRQIDALRTEGIPEKRIYVDKKSGSTTNRPGLNFTSVAINSKLSDTAFDEITPDNDTIEHNVFRTGDADEMTSRVTVDADCSIEGFTDKGDYFAHGSDFTYLEDWNRHMMRASGPHRIRFTLSADFTDATINGVQLSVDEAEEVAP